MKTLKSIALASVLASGLTGLASANTIQYVHIAGAPAYRQDSISVINTVVAGFPNAGITSSTSTNASGTGNASAQEWYIPQGVNATTDLVISASFTGSTAGVESVASGATALAQQFLKDSQSTQAEIASPVYGLSISEAHVPDFSLSDTFQATTPFNGTVALTQLPNPALPVSSTNQPVNNTYSFASLTGTELAIEPYVFVGTPGLAARGVTNITTAQAQNLYENGRLPLSFFTGKSSDATSYVYALSRDPGSGSRLIAVSEIGVGVTTSIKTYEPTVTGAAANSADPQGNFVSGTISNTTAATGTLSVPLYPAGVIASTLVYDPNAGDTGYPKFGTTNQSGLLAAITSKPTVNTTTPTKAIYFITYLNPTDAAEAVTYGGSEQLTYNGQTYSVAAVQNGSYTFWSYEQAFASPTISSQATTILNDIENNWASATLVSGIQLSGVNVSRSIDGGTVSPGSF